MTGGQRQAGRTGTTAPSSSLAQDIWFSARRLGFKSPWGYEAAAVPPLFSSGRRRHSAVCLAVIALAFAAAACDSPVLPSNHPPTVVVTSGPEGALELDSARFSWLGADRDGNLAGYYIALDDSTPDMLVESTAFTWRALEFGPHTFYVQAVDDSGARSATAARTFDCQYRGGVRARGTDTTFEITTWNIENFPKAGTATLAALRSIIPRLQIDLFAVQEIADTIAFQDLVASLAGYSGIYSADDYGSFYQKTGVIYRRDLLTVGSVRQLFWNNDSVTRPPLSVQAVVNLNGQVFDFELVVVHLKAGGSEADRAERRATCRLLKGYIDARLQGGGEQDFVVAGDWNDNLNDPPAQNSFQVFLDDTVNYRFLTAPLVGNSRYASYIGGSLIDHVMVTRDALDEYGTGWTETLRLDDEVVGYIGEVSDHRPVMAAFVLPGMRHLAR